MPPNPVDQRIASRVRSEMKHQQVSQARLAANFGRAQDFISRRLTCKVAFTISELQAVAKALDVPLSTFIGDEAVAS